MADTRNADHVEGTYGAWDACSQHEWRELADSQFSNEGEADVKCIHCGCPGAQDRKTGNTFWPAT